MQEPTGLEWWIRALAFTGFAGFGGALGHLMRTMDKKHPILWTRTILESIAAAFVGLLMLLVCEAMGLSDQWTGVIVGVSGWLGANVSIRMLETLVRKKLGVEAPVEEPPTGV